MRYSNSPVFPTSCTNKELVFVIVLISFPEHHPKGSVSHFKIGSQISKMFSSYSVIFVIISRLSDITSSSSSSSSEQIQKIRATTSQESNDGWNHIRIANNGIKCACVVQGSFNNPPTLTTNAAALRAKSFILTSLSSSSASKRNFLHRCCSTFPHSPLGSAKEKSAER